MKITSARYMISSSKMKNAKKKLAEVSPYFYRIRGEITRILRHVPDVKHPLFDLRPDIPRDQRKIGIIVVTGDKGLAGAYNQNVIKEALQLAKDHGEMKYFVVGEYGRHFFTQHHIPIEHSFLYTAQNPTMERAREISTLLLEKFDSGELKKMYIVYTDMENSLEAVAKSTRLLPFHRAFFSTPAKEETVQTPFEFLPSVEEVLNTMMPSYLSGFIYSALIDSFCSEQNARMNAMNAANQNAEELLAELSTQFNRVRQAAITQEITEISAGAKAQKRKRMRRKEV